MPSRARLLDLARTFGVWTPQKASKAELASLLARPERTHPRRADVSAPGGRMRRGQLAVAAHLDARAAGR